MIPDLCRCQYELLSFFRKVIWTWDFIKIYSSRIFIEIRYSGNFDHIFLQQKCHNIYNKNHRNYEKILFWGKYISFANTPVNWNLSKIYFSFVEAYEILAGSVARRSNNLILLQGTFISISIIKHISSFTVFLSI